MPNWIDNDLTITGPAETLQKLFFANFDLAKLLEDPTVEIRTGEQPEVYFDDDGTLRVRARTAYGPLNKILARLTAKYPGLQVINDSCEFMNMFVGHGVYKDGETSGGYMCSADFSCSALRAFAKENPWFDAEREVRAKDSMGCPPEMMEDGKSTVVLSAY